MYINKRTIDGFELTQFSKWLDSTTSIDLANHLDILIKYKEEIEKCVTNEDVDSVAEAVYAEVLLVDSYKQDILTYIQQNT